MNKIWPLLTFAIAKAKAKVNNFAFAFALNKAKRAKEEQKLAAKVELIDIAFEY